VPSYIGESKQIVSRRATISVNLLSHDRYPRSFAISLGLFVLCFAPVARADDFKTIDGKEYKDATVSRVEPDGIVLTTNSGISKVYFIELPREVQERFHYDAAKAAQFSTASQKAVGQFNEVLVTQQQEEAQERQRRAVEIAQQQRQGEQQQRQADAILVRRQQQWARARQRYAHQQQEKATARQASQRGRQRQLAGAAASQRAQDDQRIDLEHMRSLEKMQRENDLSTQQQRVEWARQNESRESYKREQQQLQQLREQQHREEGNRATAY